MKKLLAVGIVVALGAGAYTYANHYVAQEAKQNVDTQIAQLKQDMGVEVTYDTLGAEIFSESVTLDKVTITDQFGQSVAVIDSVSVAGYDPEKVAEHSSVSIKGLKLQGEALAQASYLAEESIDIDTEFNYDAKNGDADIQTQFNAGEVAHFTMDLAMTNSQELMAISEQMQALESQGEQATLQQQLELQSKLYTALQNLVPKTFEFEVKNNGKLKEVFTEVAAEQGMTYEQFQQQATAQVQMAPLPGALREAMAGFIAGSDHLAVSMALPEGTSVAQASQQVMALMANPDELAEYLSLSASGK